MQADASQFEDLGAIKENVRHNEKAIDRLEADVKALRQELKNFQLQFYAGVLILLTVNVALKYLP